MTERVLPYDRSIVPQETGYWCGPAATQVVLNSRGILLAEADLARQIGTTVNGTDYVGLIERTLDLRVPNARYMSVYIENDPPTPAQKESLWRNLVRSIDAGYGVVMNWVAPPGNKPRGVKGSVSPRYSGGTTYHYVAAMGYDDDPAARAVWIADSGFQPHGYWISFDQCASLIPPKGYAFADVAEAPEAPVDAEAQAAEVLMRLMGATLPFARYQDLLPAARQCLVECECTTESRIAMWGAQVGHESVGLRYMSELWGPTAAQAGYEGRLDLGNTQAGDGYRFRGRGPIQVTGRRNYAALSSWAYKRGLVPTPAYFVDDPDELSSERYGFVGVTWYWTTQRPMNDAADARDLVTATQYINGGQTGIEDRRARYSTALSIGGALLGLLNGDDELADVDVDRLNAAVDKILGGGAMPTAWPSRGMLAPADEKPGGVDDTVGMLLNTDGNAWNIVMILGALIGVERDVQAVKDNAAGEFPPGSYVAGNVWLRSRAQEFAQKLLPLCGLLNAAALAPKAMVNDAVTMNPPIVEAPPTL